MDSEDSIGPYITLNPSRASKFWMPDVFIDQAKALRTPTYYTKPASLRIYNDSTIRYSSRINYDVACNMDFHRFPVDEQYCEVKFESFGFTNKQVILLEGLRLYLSSTLASHEVDGQVSLERECEHLIGSILVQCVAYGLIQYRLL